MKAVKVQGETAMKWEELEAIADEAQHISGIYEIFDEEKRLQSPAAQVEFLTTVHYVERYLQPGARILDVGAGTGAYSFYFAEKGYHVDALELADKNVRVFQEKMQDRNELDLTLRQGNAVDLSAYDNDSYDVVLLFGPLYHLHSQDDRFHCMEEAKRVCKPDGVIFFAFINNDMVVLTELDYDEHWLSGDTYDHESFKVVDFPFVFHTVDQCRQMLEEAGIQTIHEVASDGVSELMADRINALSEAEYQQYLRYHFYVCEKPEMLGHSNHLLFVGRK